MVKAHGLTLINMARTPNGDQIYTVANESTVFAIVTNPCSWYVYTPDHEDGGAIYACYRMVDVEGYNETDPNFVLKFLADQGLAKAAP